MALQAEALVEEWLIKNGYFIMRGIKEKIHSIDFLAVRNIGGSWEYVHCEVQVSVRPVAYISKLTREQMDKLGVKSKTSAKLRSSDSMKASVKAWVQITYTSEKKQDIRDAILPDVKWDYWFVHGQVKDRNELSFIEKEGVKPIHVRDILKDLVQNQTVHKFSAA